ncbi:unnamed protein product [Durusdinium trenchii]|uniref:Uncharacterized protein n=1 Tax=Durusdinium trenchii TaxID=1381693 RepID=A0ABP0I9P2_9DINO
MASPRPQLPQSGAIKVKDLELLEFLFSLFSQRDLFWDRVVEERGTSRRRSAQTDIGCAARPSSPSSPSNPEEEAFTAPIHSAHTTHCDDQLCPTAVKPQQLLIRAEIS